MILVNLHSSIIFILRIVHDSLVEISMISCDQKVSMTYFTGLLIFVINAIVNLHTLLNLDSSKLA